MSRLKLTVENLDTQSPMCITVTGRDAWALQQLIEAGEWGCTPLDTPGPRWSGYIHNLRKLGVHIETIREPHAGPFPGQHARYVLRSRVAIVTTATPRLEAAHG